MLTAYLTVFGLPFIGALFVLEGMLIGKFVPTRVILVTAVVIYSPEKIYAPLLFAVATIFSTLGHYLLFKKFYGFQDSIKESKWIKIPNSRIEQAEKLFDRYGHRGIILTNALPFVRGYLAIPAAAERMDTRKFLVYSFLGSLVYFTWVVGIGVFASEILLN